MVATKLPTYANVPAETSKYEGQSCGSLVNTLAQTMKQFTDAAIKKKTKEAKAAQKDAEKKKSGGLWDQTTKGPLASFRSKVTNLYQDQKALAESEAGFLKQVSDYMDLGLDYMATTGNLISGVVSNVVDEMGVINELADAVGLGFLTPSGQNASCDKGLLVGTVNSVFEVATGAVSNGLSAVFSAQATIGMGFNAIGDMYAGLMSMPAGYLSILLTNRKALLEAIQSRVEEVVEFARDLKESDYPFDHRTFILGLHAELESADSELGQLGSILSAGGLFQDRLWDSAQKTVDEVSEELIGVKGKAPNIGLIQLYGYQRFMEQQIELLNDRQTAFARIAANIGGFRSTIESTNYQNLTLPIISQIRCQIQQVMGDMIKATEVNALIRYLVAEKRWGLELSAVYALMVNMKELAKNLSKPSTGLNDAADHLSDQLAAGGDSLVGGENYDRLIQLLDSFVKEVKRKVARNVDVEVLEGLAISINREIETLKKSSGELDKILNNFNNSIAAEGAVALQAVYSVMGVLGDQGLDNLVDAIYEGDLSKLFDTNSITGMLEGMARQAVSGTLQCCSDNAGDGDAAKRLIRMNKVLADAQKAKAVYDRYTLGYASKHLKRVTTKIVPQLKNLRKDVTRVSRAPCMNRGQSSAGADLGLTVV